MDTGQGVKKWEAGMNYQIEAQSKRRIRVRLRSSKLSCEEAEILKYAFSGIPGVTKVTVYRATGNCALEYDGDISYILKIPGSGHKYASPWVLKTII